MKVLFGMILAMLSLSLFGQQQEITRMGNAHVALLIGIGSFTALVCKRTVINWLNRMTSIRPSLVMIPGVN